MQRTSPERQPVERGMTLSATTRAPSARKTEPTPRDGRRQTFSHHRSFRRAHTPGCRHCAAVHATDLKSFPRCHREAGGLPTQLGVSPVRMLQMEGPELNARARMFVAGAAIDGCAAIPDGGGN
jgi:hypothetical protein